MRLVAGSQGVSHTTNIYDVVLSRNGIGHYCEITPSNCLFYDSLIIHIYLTHYIRSRLMKKQERIKRNLAGIGSMAFGTVLVLGTLILINDSDNLMTEAKAFVQ